MKRNFKTEQERREFAEAWSREWLSQIGLRLVRSGMKPGEPGEPAYRIISTERLTIREVCEFTTDLCNADFDALMGWGTHTMHKESTHTMHKERKGIALYSIDRILNDPTVPEQYKHKLREHYRS